MIVRIRLTKFCILSIFILSLLLCIITIPSITSTEPVNDNTIISRTDENDPTATIDEQSSQLNDNVLSDSNSQITPSENPPIVQNDVPTIAETIDEVSTTTVSPLVVDTQNTDDSQQTPPSLLKKNLSSINSFEEWKQQQLHADLLRRGEVASRNGVSPDSAIQGTSKGSSSTANIQQITSTISSPKKGKLRKNFASASCGAKIHAHNVEAQNVPSVLSSSPDEYMLNPCNAKIWFVIELCESIRILNIEIANFELFSSVPKTFRVSASDRYPTKEWHRHHLGTFNASYNRTIQSFQTTESSTYLKYVKFELLDFHGHEHYCPLSVVRIHGSNVEDEIMTMEENTNLNDLKISSNIPDENENDDDEDLTNDQQVGGIIGSAIIDLAKRVFRRQTIRGTASTPTMPITETNVLKADCHQTVLNGSINTQNLNSWRSSETFKQCIAEFLGGLWTKFNTCTIYLSQICFKLNYCCQCPVINNHSRKHLRSTVNIYINPCGYYHILTNQFICQKEKLIEGNETISKNLNNELTQDFIEKNLTIEKNDTVMINDENKNTNLSYNQSVFILNNSLPIETPIQPISNRSIEQLSTNDTLNDSTLVLESQTSSDITDQNVPQTPTIEPTNVEFNETEQLIKTIDEMVTTTPATITTTLSSSTLNNNDAIPSIISSPWLKGMLVNTKSLPELFKIIEKLNFNLTLSNRYLQELSQHYVKKLDETQQTTDLLLKASNAANEKFENLEEHLYKLQENFNDMSYRLIKLEAWIPVILSIIMCLFTWCIWSTCRLMQLRRKFKIISREHEELKKIKEIEKHDHDDEDDGIEETPVICNGVNKRKLSTDSSDSNPTRSQRVPDLTISKIKENGINKIEHKIKAKASNPTQQLLSLSTIHT